MDRKTRLLLIGASTHREPLARALPNCDVLVTENALEGVWRSGRERFDYAFVSLDIGSRALRAITCLRQTSPGMRVVVGCTPADEPAARRAVAHGADEYILEPIRTSDVEAAFGVRSPHATSGKRTPAETTGPSPREITSLGEILRNLGAGPQATLERLAALIRESFDAVGVSIQVDELAGVSGEADQPVLQELVRRQDRPVGHVALSRRTRGAYAADAVARLAEYARLIEAVITEAREGERWRNLAWTDDLSGLHNRRYFEQTLDQLVEHAAEQRLRITVLLFDIDDFKSYNDRFGHETGDKLIREVALLLKRCTRQRDIVARYGGDEFAVVFWDSEKQRVPGSVHPRDAMELAQRFCQAISEHAFECLGCDAPGPVTVSGGLACFPWNGSTREQLVCAADQALLSVKRTGKNRLHLAGRKGEETTAAD